MPGDAGISSEHGAPTADAGARAWASLQRRSLEVWDKVYVADVPGMDVIAIELLRSCDSLDAFMTMATDSLMFWFFQTRDAFLSQTTMRKWSRDRLDDYVILPAAPGFVMKRDCFFVSHFWHSKDNPDGDGKYLRLNQDGLRQQSWSYVWADWTCAPQRPRSRIEEAYFARTLQTMPGIIRNSGFMYYYPPFEPRLWILYEVAEAILTSDNGWEMAWTEDISPFRRHVFEMFCEGVRPTLDKHGYRCTYQRDRELIISWLECIVLLTKLNIGILALRETLRHLMWQTSCRSLSVLPCVEIRPYDGTLECLRTGEIHRFTPFPRLEKLKNDSNDESEATDEASGTPPSTVSLPSPPKMSHAASGGEPPASGGNVSGTVNGPVHRG